MNSTENMGELSSSRNIITSCSNIILAKNPVISRKWEKEDDNKRNIFVVICENDIMWRLINYEKKVYGRQFH